MKGAWKCQKIPFWQVAWEQWFEHFLFDQKFGRNLFWRLFSEFLYSAWAQEFCSLAPLPEFSTVSDSGLMVFDPFFIFRSLKSSFSNFCFSLRLNRWVSKWKWFFWNIARQGADARWLGEPPTRDADWTLIYNLWLISTRTWRSLRYGPFSDNAEIL